MGVFHSTISNSHRGGGIEDPILSFWFGDKIQRMASRPLPTCWDELLDWTDDASEIFQAFEKRTNFNLLSTRKYDKLDEEDTHAATMPLKAKTKTDPSSNIQTTTRLVPLVLKDQVSSLRNLPAMERFVERGKFYAEHVSLSSTRVWERLFHSQF